MLLGRAAKSYVDAAALILERSVAAATTALLAS